MLGPEPSDPRKGVYICFISNTDSSILKLKLEDGFKVRSMPEKTGVNLISFAENLPIDAVYERLQISDPCLNVSEKKFYIVTKTFDTSVNSGDHKNPGLTNLLISLIALEQKFRLMARMPQ